VKITADTNVLLRDVLQDNPVQAKAAAKVLQSADLVAIPTAVLCEFVWVLRSGYKHSAQEISSVIRELLASENVVMEESVVDAGLRTLEAGGDFADGAIAQQGIWLGADEFVSFDKQAVSILKSQGKRARLLS
jgi:predicted nucleic-acid-binding protein